MIGFMETTGQCNVQCCEIRIQIQQVIINTSLTTLAPFITQPTNIYGSGHYTVNGPLNADIDAHICKRRKRVPSPCSLLALVH